MLTIWGRNNSSNVQKVMWMIGELELPHQRHDVGGAFGKTKEEPYVSMNPNSVIPTLQDGSFTLWESNAILRYLAMKHHQFLPVSLHDQARVHQWLDWQQTVMGPAITPVFWGLVRTPEDKRDPQAIAAGIEKTVAAMAILDKLLGEHLYIVGNTFTIADIPLGIAAYRYTNLVKDRPVQKNLDRWYQAVSTRPAFMAQVGAVPIT